MAKDVRGFRLPDGALRALGTFAEEEVIWGASGDWELCRQVCDEVVQGTDPILAGKATFVTGFLEATVEQCDGNRAGWAACMLGSLNYCGRLSGTGEPDYAEAARWYQKGADLDDVQSLINLGYCHQYGRSIPVCPEKAFACFNRAALLSDSPEVYYKLGDMYRWGIGTQKDDNVAQCLYAKAAHALPDNPDYECPAYAASIAHRLADHMANTLWDLDGDEGAWLENLLAALDLYQHAERDYVRAIHGGESYYRGNLAKVIAAQDDLRELLG